MKNKNKYVYRVRGIQFKKKKMLEFNRSALNLLLFDLNNDFHK